ncbi:MAG: SDR family NAD(P)-dependent oxidoreductase [Bacteroidales bacterium]
MNKPGIVERWSLAGSIAMVTGGTKGIGAGIVSELVMHGATVVAVARKYRYPLETRMSKI